MESKKTGQLFVTFYGIGHWHFGKADRVFDPGTGLERLRTTVFIVIFWFPLIPTGSYLIEQRPGFFSSKVKMIEKLPLNWRQVFRVWAAAGCGVIAVIWLLKYV
jgi:hypothetical protein